jgi:probable DNA metabolism protein
MPVIAVETFDDWRRHARLLLSSETPPEQAAFVTRDDRPTLFESPQLNAAPQSTTHTVPRDFLELARTIACHRDEQRWNTLYCLLWRLTHGEPELLEVIVDNDVIHARRMEKAVTHDAHKAKAFVRFRRIEDQDGERFIAWHRPDHRILPLVAPFFSRRFPSMRWSILTPDQSVHWNLHELEFGPGVPASEAPSDDALEDLWRTYYGSIFNPARIKLKAMKREMPVRHWQTLPETRIIPDLLQDAPRRVDEMVRLTAGLARSAIDFLPPQRDLASLAAAAQHCQGCDLHRRATQTVFGRGPSTARLMLVGEQPGDQEDLTGEPFIGPAGQVLGEAMAAAGVTRNDVYLTNAVKHFHWEEAGKRRLHKKPPARAMAACAPWLEAEVEAIHPEVLLCLGATAAQVIVGRDTKLTSHRGAILPSRFCSQTIITWHPSAILRAPNPEVAAQMKSDLTAHLQLAHSVITGERGASSS